MSVEAEQADFKTSWADPFSPEFQSEPPYSSRTSELFQVITWVDGFEYHPDPLSILEYMKNRLATDGVIGLETTDGELITRESDLKDPRPAYLYSTNNLMRLAALAGLEPAWIGYYAGVPRFFAILRRAGLGIEPISRKKKYY